MKSFWQWFDAQLHSLEEVATELRDSLAAWDEMPDISLGFLQHMDSANDHLKAAIREMQEAREDGPRVASETGTKGVPIDPTP